MAVSKKNPRPDWLTLKLPSEISATAVHVAGVLRDHQITTVCAESKCPNRASCQHCGRATFMLLGDICTRHCGYCAVNFGTPLPPDADEPHRIAAAAKAMQLTHIVITSVTRDDLPDGGAEHFARTVSAVREHLPNATIEILVPDFRGDEKAWTISADCSPTVYNHNLETVEKLFPLARPQGNFSRSLRQLDFIKKKSPTIITKSGLMVGLGETNFEVIATARQLRNVGVEIITVGQYLPPRADSLPAARYLPPPEFAEMRRELLAMGFRAAECAPLVRSSYHAEETLSIAIKN